jgi:AcrR family transcriptional regulator
VPKRVDHDARRAEIIQATWRLIAERGIEATTMRELAREMGLANGSVTHYFPDKKAILVGAFRHVFAATNRRFEAAAAAAPSRGLARLRLFLLETLPLDDERRLEARIVIPFLEYAAVDDGLSVEFQDMMREWRGLFRGMLIEAQADGELADDADPDALADVLISAITGLQSVAILVPETGAAERLLAMADALLGLAAPRSATTAH